MMVSWNLLAEGYRQTQHNRRVVVIGVSYSLLLTVVCSSHVTRPFSGHVTYDKCSFSKVFRQLFHVSFESCIDECLLRSRCSYVQYNNAFNMCLLSDDDDSHEIASFSTSEMACIISNMAGWDTSHLRSCSAHACGLTERCNPDVTNAHAQCEPSECSSPPSVHHASLCSNAHSIGMKNAYCCDKGYVPIGNQSITCLENGTWTASNVVCKRTCPYPNDVPNVKLVNIIGDGLIEGTDLVFECKPGYSLVNVNETNLLSECKSNGKWRPNKFGCCETGYKFHGGRCYKSLLTSNASSYDEIADICKDSGLRLAGMDLVEHIVTTDTMDGLFMVDEQKADLIGKVKKCIPDYINETTLQGASLDDHLQFIWNNTLPDCDSASGWAPSEPNGNHTEQCIVYDNLAGNYTLHDTNCSFSVPLQVNFACSVQYQIGR